MKKTGLADSPLFLVTQKKNEATTPLPAKSPDQKGKHKKTKQSSKRDTTTPRNHATTIPRYQETTPPRVHGVTCESIRKLVKEFGKEAATHRFTQEEKKGIADLIYTYKNRGVKTSENEITRIAVNFVLEDYRENGTNSVLNSLLEALNE